MLMIRRLKSVGDNFYFKDNYKIMYFSDPTVLTMTKSNTKPVHNKNQYCFSIDQLSIVAPFYI